MPEDKIEVGRGRLSYLTSLAQVVSALGPGVPISEDVADLARKCLEEGR